MSDFPPSSILGLGGPPPSGDGERPVIPGLEVGEILGSGASGTVFAARHLALDRAVAVKVLHDHWRGTGEAERFADEIEVLGRVRHRNIATVYTGGLLPDGRAHCVLERIDGAPITNGARSSPTGDASDGGGSTGHPMSRAGHLRLLVAVAEGLAHAHERGILHRDLKPGNILVGNDGVPRIVDFGLSLELDAAARRRTLPESRIGTTEYMSPEQRAGVRALDPRCDVYALGLVALELLTGSSLGNGGAGSSSGEKSRSRGTDPDGRRRAIDRALASLDRNLAAALGKALAEDRERRTPSAAAFGDDLRRVLARQPVDSATVGRLTRLRLFHRRHVIETWVIGGTLATLLVALGAMGVSLWRAGERWERAVELDARTSRVVEELRAAIDTSEAPLSPTLEAELEAFLGIPREADGARR